MSRSQSLRATARPSLLAVMLAMMLPGAVLAQSEPDELTGVISASAATKISLAVPPVVANPGTRAADAAELTQVLRGDLSFSGWFALLTPEGEARIPEGKYADATAWRSVGASYLLTVGLRPKKDGVIFEVRVVETGGGEALLHKKWGGVLPKDLRRLAHAASDKIVLALTGNPGIAQTRIAFVSRRAERDKEVFLMDYDGARVRRLTNTGTINLAPAWSPDGRRLTFLSYLARKPSIYLLSDDGDVTTLHPAGGELNSAPDFAPGADQLVFSSDRDGNSEIYLYDLSRNSETRLTRHPGIDTAPCWAPSGREIAFTSDRSGTPQIYIMSADGSSVRRLSWEGRYNESAAWSPDGGRLAFVSRIKGRFEIVIHDLSSGEEKIITSGRGNKENPRWAPDGRHLVFASNQSGMYSIYTIRDDGTQQRRLTRGMPSWTPDWSPLSR